MSPKTSIGIRWTIGDVNPQGFEALRLSIWGAWKLFGPAATCVVCVNSVPLARARALTGPVPERVAWLRVSRRRIPAFLRRHLNGAMAEGVGWKFAPLQLFPDRFELALDNDCILWGLPGAMAAWLAEPRPGCVFAEDVRACLGQFAHCCGPEPRNSGIRGLPPRFDFEGVLRRLLRDHPVMLQSELDEQGLQAAAVSRDQPPRVITLEEVSICSPFPPHLPHLGRCGAHFVGLNARQLPWSLEGRPAVEHIAEHWRRHRPALYERVGIRPAK